MCVGNALDDLSLQPFLDVSANGAHTRDAIDDIHRQMEAVDLVENRKFERSVDAALLFLTVHVNVVVVRAPVREFVNKRRIGMEVENDRLVGREE